MNSIFILVLCLTYFNEAKGAACVRISPISFGEESFEFICGDLYNLLIEKPYFYRLDPRKEISIGINRNSSREGSIICNMFGHPSHRADVTYREITEESVVLSSNLVNLILMPGTTTVIQDIVCR